MLERTGRNTVGVMLMMEKFPAFDKKDDKRRLGCIRKWECAECGGKVKHFHNWVSREEFFLSGRCQNCQDMVFDRSDDQFVKM
jgi:hypothetical protein